MQEFFLLPFHLPRKRQNGENQRRRGIGKDGEDEEVRRAKRNIAIGIASPPFSGEADVCTAPYPFRGTFILH